MQQINLFQPEFRERKKGLTVRTLFLIYGVSVMALVLLQGFTYWRVHGLEKDLMSLQARQEKELKRVAELGKQFPGAQQSSALVAEVTRLRNERNTKQRVVNILDGKELGNANGYSQYFEGVARRHVDGLWVTALELRNGGSTIGINGSALRPNLVPRFLKELAQEDAFRGREFKTFKMTRAASDQGRIDFTMRTTELRAVRGRTPVSAGGPLIAERLAEHASARAE